MGILRKKRETTNDDLKEIIEGNFKENESNSLAPENNNNDLKELQIANLALATMMNPDNLFSTTNYNEEEAEDYSNACYLNAIFQSPLVEIKIIVGSQMNRSITAEPKNMLQTISDIVGKAIPRMETTGIQRILGNRFR